MVFYWVKNLHRRCTQISKKEGIHNHPEELLVEVV